MIDAQLALRAHLGLGLFVTGCFSFVFGSNYLQTPIATTRQFKSRAFLINLITMIYYIVGNIMYNTTNPNMQFIDPITLRYLHWSLTTPLILTDIMILDSRIVTDIIFICAIDVLMIVSGYISYLATDPVAIWTLFSFGCLNGGILIIHTLKYLNKLSSKHNRNFNERAILFLSWYMIIIWGFFPIIFILRKTNRISIEFELCSYVYLDIFAKGVFGVLILGIHDKLHNITSNDKMVRFANTFISIVPIERTDTSVTPTMDADTVAVGGDIIVPPPEQPHARTRTSIGNASDISEAYSEVVSILSVRAKRLLENTTHTYSVVSVKPPGPTESPPPRWQ